MKAVVLVPALAWSMLLGCNRAENGSKASPSTAVPAPATSQVAKVPVTKPATNPVANQPATLVSSHTIRGGAWVVRANGASDILRGLTVRVLRTDVPTSVVAPVVGESRRKLESEIEFERKSRDRIVNGVRVVDNVPTDDEKRLTQSLATLDSKWTNLSREPTIRLSDLLSLGTIEMKHGQAFDGMRLAVSVAEAKTNIDGRYELTGVPDGVYFLAARTFNDVFVMQWMIPIACNHDLSIDLKNDNAVVAENLRQK